MGAYDYAVIGGGIVGLSTAMALGRRNPAARILVLEKEAAWASHQTGRNSGVIHSGIYYRPGTLRARLCREGNSAMVEFCREHSLPYNLCGKVIIATEQRELPLLENIYKRGLENELHVSRLTAEEVKAIEPHVHCLAGVRVPSAGIVDYRAVCLKIVELCRAQGATLKLNARVLKIADGKDAEIVHTTAGEFESRWIISCAGLHSDRVARLGRVDPRTQIVPFRGEYFQLRPEKSHLVKGLIYPVPNPLFPFLGLHFTPFTDGTVHAGPNAVLSFKREGYRRTDFDVRDLAETLCYVGFWRLAARNAREGLKEIIRSFSKSLFLKTLQKMIPELESGDLIAPHSGVRAQALRRSGELEDDFLIVRGRNAVHVCNAPSPAATASIEIGRTIASQLP